MTNLNNSNLNNSDLKFGIDRACFYSPAYYLELSALAQARGVEKDKYLIGLGQSEMAVIPPDEGIVTMAASAASKLLEHEDKSKIRTLLLATESGIDHSKSAGIYVHRLLELPANTRTIELKQACYSGTGALQLALGYLHQHPEEKVLLITSDIARYGLNTPGESSQGGGAVAMLLSQNPRLIAIEPGSGLFTEDVMDFWRPNYKEEALVEGKISCDQYLKALKECWQDYTQRTGRTFSDHQHFLYHIPFPRLAEKAHQKLSMLCHLKKPSSEETNQILNSSLAYSKKIGNCYTGSLYLGLLSLLENNSNNLSNHRVGFYSYGSGCVAEFFSGIIQDNYQDYLLISYHQNLLAERTLLNIPQYENFYSYLLNKEGQLQTLPEHTRGNYRLSKIENHQQIYIKKTPLPLSLLSKNTQDFLSRSITSRAPGKLIISGEHSVVMGAPALAIAVNKYTRTRITQATIQNNTQNNLQNNLQDTPTNNSILFNLLNIQHRDILSRDKLSSLKSRIKSGYQSFLKGEKGIRDVLEKPFELLQYTASNVLEKLGAHKDTQKDIDLGFEIHSESEIPIGCGMGSSAASIVSLNYALSQFFKSKDSSPDNSNPDNSNPQFNNAHYFEWSLDAENIQHGKSSGIDVQMALNGGMALYQKGIFTKLSCDFPWPILIINTGPSASSTGECVTHTQEVFKKNTNLIQEFSELTQNILISIQEKNLANFLKLIKHNHHLLIQLNIVPEKIQNLISKIEQAGGAAKICGAGTLIGDSAGIIFIAGLSLSQAQNLNLNFPIEQLNMAEQGVEICV